MNFDEIIPDDYPDFYEKGEPICAQTDPEAFFPQGKPGNQSESYYNEKAAKALCSTCPYKVECLLYALTHDEIGIWGGTTAGGRRLIKKQASARGISLEEIAVEIP
jgi:WhiB family redox-sensing transcriptional regulator